MKNRSPLSSAPVPSRSAFTLMELLVVMAIIAILTALMIPGSRKVMENVKKNRAHHTAMNLKNAIHTYHTEYRRLPVSPSLAAEKEIHLVSNRELMDVLCASPAETGKNGLNTRKIVFFTDRTARPMGNGKYHSGVRIDSDGSAELYDPWGQNYYVVLDGDGNGRLKKPSWDEKTDSAEITDPIIIWSPGPDKESAKGNDNVKTW